jgi:hypothetical protein
VLVVQTARRREDRGARKPARVPVPQVTVRGFPRDATQPRNGGPMPGNISAVPLAFGRMPRVKVADESRIMARAATQRARHEFTSMIGTPVNVTRAHFAPLKRATLLPSLATSASVEPA